MRGKEGQTHDVWRLETPSGSRRAGLAFIALLQANRPFPSFARGLVGRGTSSSGRFRVRREYEAEIAEGPVSTQRIAGLLAPKRLNQNLVSVREMQVTSSRNAIGSDRFVPDYPLIDRPSEGGPL